MKKRRFRNYLLALLSLLWGLQAYAQKDSSFYTPDGNFDYVFDMYGNQFRLKDIEIDTTARQLRGQSVQSLILCSSSGYFNLYFETGSGFEQNNATHIARRNVMCQLFTDLSNFIVPANVNNKVNIWVRDIANIPGIGNPQSSGVLGLATSFYSIPANAPTISGIADGEVWRTINSGNNSYTSVTSPLNTVGGQYQSNNATFYHGMMAFNFANPGINWHTALNTATSAGLYDLYTVALHEITHALGFASLIDYNGFSKFAGAGYNYYTRYDLFLKTQQGQNLINNTGNCSLYQFGFNPQLNANTLLSPFPATCGNNIPYTGSLDHTTCSSAVNFAGSVNKPVYTPDCFERPSSLSHLEDECPTAANNNLIYVMSNANGPGPGYMKRYLKPDERKVLCDIGYRVNSTYGNTLYTANNFNYNTTQCPGLWVAGTNDGINSNGTYAFSAISGNPVTIPGGSILANDFAGTMGNSNLAFECLQDVYGVGTLNIVSGNASSTITYTPQVGFVGSTLLRYVPYNSATNVRGNITYIIVHVNSANCIATACNLVMNGGFESGQNCGQFNSQQVNPVIDCWEAAMATPDYYVRNCVASMPGMTIPTGNCINSTAIDTWNGNPNNKMLGLWKTSFGCEVMQTLLSSAIQPNVSYTLSFWARVANNFNCGNTNNVTTLTFKGDLGILAYVPNAGPFSFSQLLTTTTVTNDNQWHFFSIPFTYTGNQALNTLLIGNTSTLTNYVLIDDVSIVPTATAATFTPPTPLCIGSTIPDLSAYVIPPGGTFSGSGVSLNSGIYSFTASTAGTYNITYTYVNNLGCTTTVPAQIVVSNAQAPNVSVSASPGTSTCINFPVTLTATGANTYTWIPTQSCTSPCATVTVSSAVNTTYTVTGTDLNGCSNSASITITVSNPSSCCSTATHTIPNNATSSSIGPIPSGSFVDVQGNFIIDQLATTYINVHFRMATGAKITVNNNSSLILDRCKLFSCMDMWDGIYLIQSGTDAGDIKVVNSSMEDAINGIVADGNSTTIASQIDLQSSSFNKNYYSLRIRNSAVPNYPLILRNNNFTCAASVNSLGNLLKAPYTTSRSFIGIELNNVRSITIGDASSSTFLNRFDNMSYGLYILLTTTNVYNNRFTNITGNIPICPPGPCPPATGIAIFNPDVAQSGRVLTVGGTASNQFNTFVDVFRAIDAQNISTLIVLKNQFSCTTTPLIFPLSGNTTSQYGVRVSELKNKLDITGNSFTNFAFTIDFRRNTGTFTYNPLITINKNVIGTQGTGYVSKGIFISDLSTNTITIQNTFQVQDNDLNDIRDYGIQCHYIKNKIFIRGSTYLSQSILMRYSSSGSHFGIYLLGCDSAQVLSNEIYSSGNFNQNMVGICLRLSTDNRVSCNSIYRIGSCITVIDNCFSTFSAPTYSCGIINNTFSMARIGLNMTNNAIIGTQGDATHPCGNSWLGTAASYTMGQTRTDASSLPVNSRLYCRSSSSVQWPTNHQTNGGTAYANGVTVLSASNPAWVDCNTQVGGGGGDETKMQKPLRPDSDPFAAPGGSANEPLRIEVYPNPSDGFYQLRIQAPLHHARLSVYNSIGVLCFTREYSGELLMDKINLSAWENGMYLIRVQADETDQVLKVMKIK